VDIFSAVLSSRVRRNKKEITDVDRMSAKDIDGNRKQWHVDKTPRIVVTAEKWIDTTSYQFP